MPITRVGHLLCEGVIPPTDDQFPPGAVTVRTIQRLMREGITEEEARDLINLLGINWPALLREAQLIAKDRPQGLGAMGNQTEDDKA